MEAELQQVTDIYSIETGVLVSCSFQSNPPDKNSFPAADVHLIPSDTKT